MKSFPEKFHSEFVMGDRDPDKTERARAGSLIGVAKIYSILKFQFNSTSTWACLEFLWKGECQTIISVYSRQNGWEIMEQKLVSCLKYKQYAIIGGDMKSKIGWLASEVEEKNRPARYSHHNWNGALRVEDPKL